MSNFLLLTHLAAPLAETKSLDWFSGFAEGVLSFTSPCVLPLVPGYLSFISGVSVARVATGDGMTGKPAALSGSDMRRVIVSILFFIAGFTAVFITIFALANVLFDLLGADVKPWIQIIAGVAVIVMGLHFLGVFKLGFLNMERRFHLAPDAKPVGMFGAFLVGAAFAAGWTPCVGPFLSAATNQALSAGDAWGGAAMMVVYSAGLGIPFLLAGLFMSQLLGFIARIRRHFQLIEIVSGLLLIVVGALIITNNLTQINRIFSIG